MIVKNESHIIVETLTKLTKYIKFDYFVISDTGSTDNTIELIESFFKEIGIIGEIFQDPFQDFGYNRSLALEHAFDKTDYVLIFDADDYIVGDFKLPEIFNADAYMLNFGSETFRYSRMALVNNRIKWKYIGVLHEYITCDQEYNTSSILGNYYIVSGKSGSRSKDPEKYLKDAKILSEAYQLNINDPISNRYCFYCANSYKDAGEKTLAIEWYKKTIDLQGWSEEKYISCIEIFNLNPDPCNFFYLVKSFTFSPKRIEGIYQLIRYYTCEHQYQIALMYYSLIQNYYENEYINDDLSKKLFVKITDYSFYLPYYMIIVAGWTKKNEIGLKMYSIIFEKMTFPGKWWVDNLFYNMRFFNNLIIPPKIINFMKENGYSFSNNVN